MNKFLLGVCCATALNYCIEKPVAYNTKRFEKSIAETPFDTTLNQHIDAKTIISILSEYSLNHLSLPAIQFPDSSIFQLLGQTDYQKGQITINDNASLNTRRFTILHELEHIISRYHGQDYTEDQIDSLAEISYKKIYAIK